MIGHRINLYMQVKQSIKVKALGEAFDTMLQVRYSALCCRRDVQHHATIPLANICAPRQHVIGGYRMTLQQMRYLLAILDSGSITAAAQAFYISQSSLSEALREVEREYGIKVFNRTNRGVTPTAEGIELISMIRCVVQQDDLIAERFSPGTLRRGIERLTVSSQRYSFVVEAISALMNARPENLFSFTLRETDTEEILSDVRTFRSNVGVISITSQNKDVVGRELERSGLNFAPIVEVAPCVVLSAKHPLAGKSKVRLADLEGLPRIVFEQRNGASEYYAEDPLPEAPHRGVVEVRDRGSMVSLLNLTDAYAIGSGLSAQGMDKGTVAVPLATNEKMSIGYVLNPRAAENALVEEYLAELKSLSRGAGQSRL